jgi:HTH-type transcriptional regulator / antitoxin HigA
MSFIFDRSRYTELLTKYQPKVIKTEEEYRQILAVAEYFVFKKDRSPEELALYDLVVMLVIDYESKICPINDWRTNSPS